MGGFPKRKPTGLPGGSKGDPLGASVPPFSAKRKEVAAHGIPNRINSAWYARTYHNKNLVCGPPSFGRALARGPTKKANVLFSFAGFLFTNTGGSVIT